MFSQIHIMYKDHELNDIRLVKMLVNYRRTF